MAWILVAGQAGGQSVTGTGTLASASTAGNLLIAVVGCSSSTAITPPAGQGTWTSVITVSGSATSEVTIFANFNNPGGLSSFAFTGGASPLSVSVAEFTCPNVSYLRAASATGTITGGKVSTVTATNGAGELAGDLVIAAATEHLGTASAVTWTQPSGFTTSGTLVLTSASQHAYIAYELSGTGASQAVILATGTTATTTGAWSGVVASFTQPAASSSSQQPSGVRVTLLRAGSAQASVVTASARPVQATFYPLNRPASAIIRPQPQRGRTTSRAGTYDQLGPPVYPLRSPVATGTTISPSSRNGATAPPRGRSYGISHSGVYDQAGPPVYPLHSAVAQGGTSAAVSRNGAGLPPRGRTTSRPGLFESTGTAFYPYRRPAGAVVRPVPSRGRTGSRQGAFQGTGAPLTQLRRPVQARQPLARRGSTQGRAGTVAAVVPAQAVFYPLTQPARARIPVPSWRGTCRSMAVLTVTTVQSSTVFYPQGLIALKGRGFPPRGRTAGRTGTFTPAVIAITPPALGQPSGVRVIYQRTGLSLSQPGTVQPAGPAVYPLQRPVAAVVRPLPGRGRMQSRSGTFTAVVPHTAVAYPLSQPARARLAPPSWRGTCRSMAVLTTTLVPSVTTLYPLNRPASAVTRPQPARGRTASRPGIFQGPGPAVTALQRAVRARLPQQPFLKGRTSGNPGVYGQAGPKVTPLRGPISPSARGMPPKGRAAGRAGIFSAAVQAGPPLYPLHSPVAAVIRPLPPRGRTQGRAGVFQGSGPAVKPLQHPVYAWRPGPRRGVCLTSIRPAPPSGTGSAFYPFRKALRAWVPPPRRGRSLSLAGTFTFIGSGQDVTWRTWAPRSGWVTGEPSGRWSDGAPGSGWVTGDPFTRTFTSAPRSGWTENEVDLQ